MINWDAVGAIGEIVGATTVFISIVYLALQVKQSSSQIRSSGYQAAAQTANDFLKGLSSNPEALRVFEAAQESYGELAEEDQILARTLFFQLFLMYESLYYQYVDGVVDPDMWEGRRILMFNFLAMPEVALWWKDWRHVLGAKFLSYIAEHEGAPPEVNLRF